MGQLLRAGVSTNCDRQRTATAGSATTDLSTGLPFDVVRNLRGATARQLIVAGGITSTAEIEQLDALGVDAVVGMAIYTGQVNA